MRYYAIRYSDRAGLPSSVGPIDMFVCQITTVSCAHVGAGCAYPLFVGHSSGRVLGVRVRLRAGAPRVRTRALLAHAAAVRAIAVCARAALLATASVDGRIVLWDLNK